MKCSGQEAERLSSPHIADLKDAQRTLLHRPVRLKISDLGFQY